MPWNACTPQGANMPMSEPTGPACKSSARGRRRTAPPFPRKGMRSTIGAARMSVRDPGAAGLRGRARRAPVDCAAHTSLNVMASRAIAILAAIVVMMFAVVGCTGLQEQGRGEAAGGEDAAQPAREAKSTTTTSRRCATVYAWRGLRSVLS